MISDKVEVRPDNPLLKECAITASTMALAGLAEKRDDVDVLRQMLHFLPTHQALDGAARHSYVACLPAPMGSGSVDCPLR